MDTPGSMKRNRGHIADKISKRLVAIPNPQSQIARPLLQKPLKATHLNNLERI
jgi:hypothetical protein